MISIQQMASFRLRVIKDTKTKSISATARKYRITRQTVHRWLKEYDGTLKSLEDKSRRPHHNPREHTEEEKKTALRVASEEKALGLVCLWVELKQNHGYKRSVQGLYKLLVREGIIKSKKRERRESKPYERIEVPGERIQVDVKYVPSKCLKGGLAQKKYYQYTAIDECTRWRYTAIFDEKSTYSSKLFVEELIQKFPFTIQCIQTDNGTEFTSILQGATKPSAFEAFLESLGIRHKRIAVATPRHNGKVERSHRTDQERFYDNNEFYSLKELKEKLSLYLIKSNARPLMAHDWRSASDMVNFYLGVL
jgi:transposase InsO family protein